MILKYSCIDMASDYCPCYLAETGDCVICSILRGQNNCDCRWQGICIFQEFLWNGKKKASSRKMIKAEIVDKKIFTDNLFIFTLKLPKDVHTIYFSQAGTYVFVKSQNSPDFYEVPLCVMDFDEENNLLVFAVQLLGPKTKALFKENKNVVLRGPYYNGIFGLKYIKSSFNRNCLLVGRGIGQASLILVAKSLKRGYNKILAVLNPGSLSYNIAKEILFKEGVSVKEVNDECYEEIILKDNYDLIYSAGADFQHNFIYDVIKRNNLKAELAISNNAQICCGEGVCGSCAVNLNGEKIRLCKMQLEGKKILEEGLL